MPLFILPGLSTGAILLQVNDTGAAQGSVTVLVQSLTNSAIKSAPMATITIGSQASGSATLILAHNAGLSIAEGSTATLTSGLLQTSDSDASMTPANVVYTLASAPTQGSLLLGGQALAAGGTFTQDDINSGRLAYHASEEGGDSFGFSVAAAGATGASGTFLIAASDPAVIAQGGYSVSASEGTLSPAQTIATFTDPGGFEPQATFSAVIDWGDGSTSAGAVVFPTDGQTATVTGQHAYAEQGSYVVRVTLRHEGAPDATASSTTVVSDPAVAGSGGFTYSGVAGGPATSQTVALFTDPGGAEPLADYSASIN